MARIKTRHRLALATILPLLWMAFPALAQNGGSSIGHVGGTAPVGSAEDCATRYHQRLQHISENELKTYRNAAVTITEPDPRLLGRLVFDAGRRPDLEPQAAEALRAANALARRQGRTSFARDANTRWIAGRIREDLTDYLRQEPTPFLCAGVEPYLAKLREYAVQGAPSPATLSASAAAQALVASRSLDVAYRAMRPAPLPRFAPADRPSAPTGPDGDDLLALKAGFSRVGDNIPATRLAERPSVTRISESSVDPDLPPIGPAARRSLKTPAELARAILALAGTAERKGFLPAGEPTDAVADEARPVLARLTALSGRMSRPGGAIADPIVRHAVTTALSDLEALDYLLAASSGTGDPLTDSMYATMSAIERAHADSCTCRP